MVKKGLIRISPLKKIAKAGAGILGIRLIDPVEVFYLPETDTFYPINSKAGCSSLKLHLIRQYEPGFESSFPEIHHISPADLTGNRVQRLFFYNFKAYIKFAKGKNICLVVRDPYKRIYSCFLDVAEGKNIPYNDPSGLDRLMGFKPTLSFPEFLNKVLAIPDYLADRHFRPQSFYYSHEIIKAVGYSRIITIAEFMEDKTINPKLLSPGKLNSNMQNLPPEIRENLERNERFSQKFKRDLALYKQVTT